MNKKSIKGRSMNMMMGLLGAAFFTLHSSFFVSCSDWSDHFDEGPAQGSGQSVMQLLEQNAETQAFASLVKQSSYAGLLSSDQSFTVFAPQASALGSAAATDDAALNRLVGNHIARQTYASSTPATTGVRMLSGKIYYFGDGTFGQQPISRSDEKADNGLVHQLQAQIPYANNIYEQLQDLPECSRLYDFISQFNETRFDAAASTEIDINEEGQIVYDSVMVSYNRLLEDSVYGIGHIAREDSTYTMLLPTNKAWDAAYERIAPSFIVYDADQERADSLQDVRTKLAIVSDLVYRGDTLTEQSHGALSTTGSIMASPEALLAGTTRMKVSNGYVLKAPTLNYERQETWNKPITVEAEEQNGRTNNPSLTTIYTRYVESGSLVDGVSGDSYIEVVPNSSATNPTVIFDIPGVLAGTYNVYAVFLPATVEGPAAELDSTRIAFSVKYQNAKGRTTTKSNDDTSKSLIISGTQPTRLLAFKNLVVPVSNTTDRLWLMDEPADASALECTTTLTITTNPTKKEFEAGTLARRFRLDCIIFEPVEN